MVEGKWHEDTRKKLISEYSNNGYTVESSHSDKNILLYIDSYKRENFLSDVDLVIIKDGKIEKLIEIQQSISPKEILGIITATNLSNKCMIDSHEYSLNDVILSIVVKQQKGQSKKPEQLELIKNNFSLSNGCLKEFQFEVIDHGI